MDNHEKNLNSCCWICFTTDEEDQRKKFIQPCKCQGDLQFVHQSCLQRWVRRDAKQRIRCPNCGIHQPIMDRFATFLERADHFILRSSLYGIVGSYLGSLYWSSMFYGAVIVLQVHGYEEGLMLLRNAGCCKIVFGLPAITIGLFVVKMIRWEDFITRYLQDQQRKRFNAVDMLMPIPVIDHNGNSLARLNVSTVIFESLLLLPSASILFGNIFFQQIESNFNRTLIGGLAFIAFEGIVKIYFRQKKYQQIKQRIIVDRTEENIQRYHHEQEQYYNSRLN